MRSCCGCPSRGVGPPAGERRSQLGCLGLSAAPVHALLLDAGAGAVSFVPSGGGLEAAGPTLGVGAAVRCLATLRGMLGAACGCGSGGWRTGPTTFTPCPGRWKLQMELSKCALRWVRGVLSAGVGVLFVGTPLAACPGPESSVAVGRQRCVACSIEDLAAAGQRGAVA